MELMRVSARLQIPYLDGTFCAAREEDAAFKLVESEGTHASAMGTDVMRAFIYASRVGTRCELAIEAMLRRGRKRTEEVGRDGSGEVPGIQITRFAGEQTGLHSSGL